MSTRCNLLIIALLMLLWSSLQGTVYQYHESGLQYHVEKDSAGTPTAHIYHAVDIPLQNNLRAFVETDFFWADKDQLKPPISVWDNDGNESLVRTKFYQNWRKSTLYDRMNAKIELLGTKEYAKLQYRNQYFTSNKTNAVYVADPMGNFMRPEFTQNVYLQNRWNLGYMQIETGSRVRISNFNLDEWVYTDTDVYENKRNVQKNESFLEGLIKVPVKGGFYAQTSLYLKNDDASAYDQSRLGIGLGYTHNFNIFHMLEADYLFEDCNNSYISSIRNHETDHYMTSHVRYTHRLGNKLFGFVSFINRAVYIEDAKQLWLVANSAKVQMRYSFDKDPNGDAFVLGEVKYSPEHKSSVVGLECNYPVNGRFYVNAGEKLMPQYIYEKTFQLHLSETKLGCSYYFTPFQQLYISDTFSALGWDGVATTYQHNLSLGTKMAF